MSDLRGNVRFFATAPHDCSYLTEQTATTLFADPDVHIDAAHYERLALAGFRRSGKYYYRPQCTDCRACISVRVATHEFDWRRRFRKTLKRNSDLTVEWRRPYLDSEIYQLYSRYIASRHRHGDMYPPSTEQFRTFLMVEGPDTQFMCLRDSENNLVSVGVVDVLPKHGLSAIYTFFDPDQPKRGLGQMSLLTQIIATNEADLDYLYLGYWIRDCEKMNYKTDYRPLEMLIGKSWLRVKQ